jgi:hypothetical protein
LLQPTEANFVEWSKEILPQSKLEIKAYVVETQIYSVDALYEFYNNPNNSYYVSRDKDRIPYKYKPD